MIESSPARLVSDISERFEGLETGFRRAYWESQISATDENAGRRAELELELREVKGDPETYSAVVSALESGAHDPEVARQLETLRLSLTANQMDPAHRLELVQLSSAIETDFSSFRPEVDGRRLSEADIDEVLRTSQDEDGRREVWSASKQIGALVGDRVRELVRVRNEAALAQGFADHYRMSLELQELSEEWLFSRMDELEKLTNDMFSAWKAKLDDSIAARVGRPPMPWDYGDPFLQMAPPEGKVDLDPILIDASAPSLAARTFAGWGIDITGVIGKSDLYPRELKCQHAFCLDVDRRGDVRILANVVPGERWVEVMLHESGHAAYDISLDEDLPYLLRRAAHISVTESIAIMSGRLLRDPEWLVKVAGADATAVRAIELELAPATAISSLVFARWGLVMTHFERELYSDPEQDLDARWWELVERFQGIAVPDDVPPGAWAAKIHLAVSPVYYHNYLLGEMLASQLRSAIERETGGFVDRAETGAFLKERLFAKGNLVRWDSLIEQVTGEALTARYFAQDLAD